MSVTCEVVVPWEFASWHVQLTPSILSSLTAWLTAVLGLASALKGFKLGNSCLLPAALMDVTDE